MSEVDKELFESNDSDDKIMIIQRYADMTHIYTPTTHVVNRQTVTTIANRPENVDRLLKIKIGTYVDKSIILGMEYLHDLDRPKLIIKDEFNNYPNNIYVPRHLVSTINRLLNK